METHSPKEAVKSPHWLRFWKMCLLVRASQRGMKMETYRTLVSLIATMVFLKRCKGWKHLLMNLPGCPGTLSPFCVLLLPPLLLFNRMGRGQTGPSLQPDFLPSTVAKEILGRIIKRKAGSRSHSESLLILYWSAQAVVKKKNIAIAFLDMHQPNLAFS